VLPKVAHAFLYIDGLLSVAIQTAQAVAILPFFIPERSIALVNDWLFTKGAEIDPNLPHANKSVIQGSTRILIYIDGLLSVAPNARCCYLTFFHSRTFNCTKNDWLVHQKELKLIPTCPITKVLLQGSTRILIYMDGLLQSHQTVPKLLLSYLLPYSRTFNCSKRLAGSPKS
jgi:hypothetical protein